jgi:hypothetical protein
VAIAAAPGITCVLDGIGQRFCAGNGNHGQLAKAAPVKSITNPAPVITVDGPGASAGPFAVLPPFVTITDAQSKPVCSLKLSVQVAATCDANSGRKLLGLAAPARRTLRSVL